MPRFNGQMSAVCVFMVTVLLGSGASVQAAVADSRLSSQHDVDEHEAPAFEPDSHGAEKNHIQVTIDQKPYRLEIMEEAPRGNPPPDGWPMVLITHGAAGRTSPSHIGPNLHRHWLSYFAARGYYSVAVARRGFATSDGPRATVNETCLDPDPEGYLLEQAKDLEATIHSIRRNRPVDPDTVLVVGHSAGGAAALALNQRIQGLKGIISVAGGLYRWDDLESFNPDDVYEGCELYRTALIDTIEKFAGQKTTPSLWLYSKNDDFFSAELARSMTDAWNIHSTPETAAQLRLLPASDESHKDFIRASKSINMASAINEFLLGENLPAEPEDLALHLESCLKDTLHPVLKEYLDGQSHRALTVSRLHDWLFWETNTVSLEAAAIESLTHCKALTGDGCELLAWDVVVNDSICMKSR